MNLTNLPNLLTLEIFVLGFAWGVVAGVILTAVSLWWESR